MNETSTERVEQHHLNELESVSRPYALMRHALISQKADLQLPRHSKRLQKSALDLYSVMSKLSPEEDLSPTLIIPANTKTSIITADFMCHALQRKIRTNQVDVALLQTAPPSETNKYFSVKEKQKIEKLLKTDIFALIVGHYHMPKQFNLPEPFTNYAEIQLISGNKQTVISTGYARYDY